MSERESLLAAIRATPDDDTPRLVFADWLDENEPDAKPPGRKGKTAPASPSSWAALIRAECALARLKGDDSAAAAVYDFFEEFDDQTFQGVRWDRALPDMVRRLDLVGTANRARSRARSRLAELIPKDAGLWALFDTHRGFPATLYITRPNKLDVARFDQLPAFGIQFGYFVHESPAVVRDLVAGGLLDRVCAVTLPGTRADLMPALSAGDATGVRAFTLRSGPGAVEVVVRWLTATANWAGLRDLRLASAEGLGGEGAVRIFRADHLRRLVRLHLRGNENWTPRTVQGLAAFTDLRDLRLIDCGLDDAAAERLANMPALANLRTLNLTNNRITGVGASALLASPHLKNLAVLDFENNPVRGLDRTALANAPAGGLRALAVQSCRLTTRDVTALASSPRVSELMYFAACESLTEPAVARLVEGFGTRAPAVLYLRENGIAAAGAEVLAHWPAASQIDMLHLEGNPLSTVAARALACCPHLKRLTHICAGTVHAAGRKALRERFGKRAHV